MVRTISIGCAILSLTGCLNATEDEATSTGANPDRRATPGSLYGHVFELGPGVITFEALVDGAEVCTDDGDSCTTTERGSDLLEGLKPQQDTKVSVRKAGYVPGLLQAGVSGYADAGLLSISAARRVAEAAGVRPPAETGGIVVMIIEPGYGMFSALSGASFAAHAPHRARSVYADELGAPDGALHETSSAGWGAALGIAPGTITVEAMHQAGGRRCGSWSGHVSDLINPAEVEVRAGELTVVTMVCLQAAMVPSEGVSSGRQVFRSGDAARPARETYQVAPR